MRFASLFYSHYLVIHSMILTRNNHDQMTTVLKSDYSVHAIKKRKPPAITAEGLLYEEYY